LPRCPEDKGKVENKVGVLKRRLRLAGQCFANLPALQAWSDGEQSLSFAEFDTMMADLAMWCELRGARSCVPETVA